MMSKRKTQENNASVEEFIGAISNETRRKDSLIAAKLMETVSGKKPKMWGTSIIGCGKHYYSYANGQEAEICKIGFSPRAKSLVFYLAKFDGKVPLLKQLGKHSVRGGCLYITRLEDVDFDILAKIVEKAYLQKSEN